MKHYIIILTSLHERIERSVIANSTVQAIRIGITMMPECNSPCSITCKPAWSPIKWPAKECA